MSTVMRNRIRQVSAILAVVLVVGVGGYEAGEPKEYAYLFVQGKLSSQSLKRSLSGITMRLTGEPGVFETVTLADGRFVFEKLPVASYQVELRTPTGQVLKTVRDMEIVDPDRKRFDIKIADGEGTPLRIVPTDDRVAFEVPEPPPQWKKFWQEFLIFVGVILLLAL